MHGIVHSIRIAGIVALFAVLAGACGKSIAGPSPDSSYGDETVCIEVNGHLICR